MRHHQTIVSKLPLAQKIHQLMTQHSISSGTRLAQAINLPAPTVNRLLTRSVTNPRLSTMRALANHFDISLNDLIGQDQPRKPDHHQSIMLKPTLLKLMEQQAITSGSQLAKHLDLPPPTINRLLCAHVTDPHLSTLLLIANYFSITIDELVFGPQ